MRVSKALAYLGLVASFAGATPFPYFDLQHCNVNNPVLQILSSLQMSSFCTSFLNYQTSTSAGTSYASIYSTVITTINGTLTSTQFIATTSTSVTQTLTTTTYSSTTYSRGPYKRQAPSNGLPPQLCCWGSAAVSTACSCYVTPASAGTPTTVSSTIYSTLTSTTASTLTTSATYTSTSTSTTTTTASSAAATGAFVLAGTYNQYNQPTQYYQIINTPTTVVNYQDGYLFCSSTCGDTQGCTQIFFGPYQTGGYRCVLGTSGANAWNANQIAANVPGAPQVNYWYNFV